jgi:BirA family transcriptional regulator, biotin operon repressor / biotin---[acetyl-CoA-carboxylase] ligase
LATSGPHRIVHLHETGSTNADAMRLALAGEELPLWVMADVQTSGRGRAGRQWQSPPGNLCASLAFSCIAPLEKAGQLSLIAGISVIDAVRATTSLAPDVQLRLKWPNDILMNLAKLGGILVESTTAPGRAGFVAILGFGLNVLTSPDDLGAAATALARHGNAPSGSHLIQALDEHVSAWLARWDQGNNFAAIRNAWIERAGSMGEPITINTVDGPVSGTYEGLSETGALHARVDGVLREFSHGDVALVGSALQDGAV